MSYEVAELREKAESGSLSEAEEAYVRDREGIGYWAGVAALLDEPSFDEEEDESEYESWTNEERRDELEARGLSTEGNKPDLIARLVADDEGTEE